MHGQLANCVNSLVKESKTHYSNLEIDPEVRSQEYQICITNATLLACDVNG